MKATATLLVILFSAGLGACDCGGRLTPAELTLLADKAAEKASRLRGLSMPEPTTRFKTEVATKEQVRSYLRERLVAVDASKDFETTTEVLADFGAVAEGVDLQKSYLAVATEQVAGFYDWEKRTLFMVDWIPSRAQGPVLVHEITHALQDHHFGLGRFMNPMRGYGDAQHAVQALIEGDATLVMVDAFIGGEAPPEFYRTIASEISDQAHLSGVPDIINEMITFPYVAGLTLALKAREEAGGWAGVDRLYTELPLSTEQVMHPEKLVGGSLDFPQDVLFEVPQQLADLGYEQVESDVMGELLVRFVIRQGTVAPDLVDAAAAGWDGDRVMLLREPTSGDTVTLLASLWDSANDAREAFAGLAKTRRPALALERLDKRLVGLWGELPRGAADVARGVLERFTAVEVQHFQYFERAVEKRMGK